MTRDVASRELERIEICPRSGGKASDVWLRKNIAETDIELPEGGSQHVWEATVTHGTLPGTPTEAEIEADFDELWQRFEDETLTDAERISDARDTARTNGDAIAELAEMVAEGEVTMEDLSQAIMELAEIVGGGE